MRYTTKQKWVNRIYRWICKLFNYQEQYQPQLIKYNEKKIETIRGFYAVIPDRAMYEFNIIEDHIKDQLAMQIARELIKTNAITFEFNSVNQSFDSPTGIIAKLNFVK